MLYSTSQTRSLRFWNPLMPSKSRSTSLSDNSKRKELPSEILRSKLESVLSRLRSGDSPGTIAFDHREQLCVPVLLELLREYDRQTEAVNPVG